MAESMNQTRSEPSDSQPISREDTASDLRSRARGSLATEAAVELLIGACQGRLVEPRMALPAVGSRPHLVRRDPDRRRHWVDCRPGEVRILTVIEALVLGTALHDLAGLLAGPDPRSLALGSRGIQPCRRWRGTAR